MNLNTLLDSTPRLRAWYKVGPVQRAELEHLVQQLINYRDYGLTADGELVCAGTKVWVLDSLGKPTKAAMLPLEALTDYYLFDQIPVAHSFSTRQAALDYKRANS
jgi:hypothetical protein